jgi:prostatic aicd phosphatase
MINTTNQWCSLCGNTESRGCEALTLASEQGASSVHFHQKISPVGAGFLGAGLMLAVALLTLLGLALCGCLSFGGAKRSSRRKASETDSTEKA